MRTPPTVAVFGLSGVGKTTLITHASAAIDGVLHLQASVLIKAGLADASLTSEALRTCSGDQVLANQRVLIAMFERAVNQTSANVVLFDGHLVIDSDSELIEIPLSVVAALRPSMMVHVAALPEVIAEHRRSDLTRKRPERPIEVLEHQQARSESLCRFYASELGVEAFSISPDKAANLSAQIARLTRQDGGRDKTATDL